MHRPVNKAVVGQAIQYTMGVETKGVVPEFGGEGTARFVVADE
jgi:hypothetical protein